MCEGACGCANSSSNPQDLSIDSSSVSVTSPINVDREISQSDQAAIASSSTGETNERQEDDFSVSKDAVVKLLGSKLTKLSHHSASSTATSSPCETVRCSSRKSFDSCYTKISIISACDKLQDEFEIVSEAASSVGCITNPSTVASTPNNMPQNIIGKRGQFGKRRYSSCDLDSLYEGIQILDSYLARRDLNISHGSQQSVTVTLFGTPKHGSACDQIASSRQTRRKRCMHARIWRSSEDASLN